MGLFSGVQPVQPCIWMTAGILTYKLCDRGFDCERCPLDAALRRETSQESILQPLCPPQLARTFPDDRMYSSGHLWVQTMGEPGSPYLRVGIDAFAAVVLGSCRSVSCQPDGCRLKAGDVLATIDMGLGSLTLGAPVPGNAVEQNPLLWHDPTLMVSQPYTSGWIAHLVAESAVDLDHLMPHHVARDRALADLRQLRRQVAMQLLTEDGGWATAADGGEPVCDLRALLGGVNYLELLTELIH